MKEIIDMCNEARRSINEEFDRLEYQFVYLPLVTNKGEVVVYGPLFIRHETHFNKCNFEIRNAGPAIYIPVEE